MADSRAAGYRPEPDTILYNGQVLTVDDEFRIAQALAVRGRRIVAVGADDDVLAAAGPDTRRIDLEGRTVLPGFVDTHAHLDREGLRRAYPDLQGCRSIGDVQAVVRREAAQKRPGEWIVLLPLGEPPFHLAPEQTLAERRYPDRHDLDQAAPDNPVWVRSVWGLWNNTPPFVHVLNSAALRACGITADTPPPASTVEIERDERGALTGRILEQHFMPVAEFTLLRAAPRFTRQERLDGLRLAMRLHAAAGTTSIYEGHGIAAEVLDVYKELHDAGEQRVRAYLPISPPPWRSLDEAEREIRDWAHYASGPGFGDAWLKVGGLYLGYPHEWSELTPLAQAAWPYTGWAGFADQYHPLDEYVALCRLAARHRLRVTTAAAYNMDEVLAIWEAIDRDYPIRDLRWVLMHANKVEPARDFPRIKRLGCVMTSQPASYVYRSGLALWQKDPEPDKLMAYRAWSEAGLPWALSTDNKPYWLQFTLWVAVTRRERIEGRVLSPEQRLSLPQALRALTYAGAQVCFEEREKGSLEVGKLADLQVLDADPLTVDPDALQRLRVELTMVDGVVVHSSGAVAEPT